MRYDAKTKLQCRALFVEVQGRKSPKDISDAYNGSPSKAQILNWAKEVDENGKSWYDYQREADDYYYTQITPAERARKIDNLINRIIDGDGAPGAIGDSIAKLVNSQKVIVDPRLQYGVIFQCLDDLMTHVETKYRGATKENLLFFIDVLKTFRDEVKER